MTRTIRYGVASALVAMLAGLAACESGSPMTSTMPSSTAMSDDQIMAIAREYAQCMRDNGIPGFQEGRLENGRLVGGGMPEPRVDPSTLDAAQQACRSVGDRLPASIFDSSSRPTAEELEKMERFSACVREHGFPDWPDPTSDGGFPIEGTPLETALKSDQGQQVRKACQQHYDGPIRMSKQ